MTEPGDDDSSRDPETEPELTPKPESVSEPELAPVPIPVVGFFGPGSQMWRINREAVLLGVGPASLLLQIAHPLVAEGVAEHSRFRVDPFGRLRRTLGTTLDLIFGDGRRAERAVQRLNGIHTRVTGEIADPQAREISGARRYTALDPELLLWVQVTLLVMGLRAYGHWIGPVSPDQRERMWQESRRLGGRLGIPETLSPPSWVEVEAWFDDMLRPGGPIVITQTARSLAPQLLRPPLPWTPAPLVDLAVLPGLALLPPRIRADFGISWSARRDALAGAMHIALRAWVRSIPWSWRAMPQARAAEHRCAARAAERRVAARAAERRVAARAAERREGA